MSKILEESPEKSPRFRPPPSNDPKLPIGLVTSKGSGGSSFSLPKSLGVVCERDRSEVLTWDAGMIALEDRDKMLPPENVVGRM